MKNSEKNYAHDGSLYKFFWIAKNKNCEWNEEKGSKFLFFSFNKPAMIAIISIYQIVACNDDA